ncbi:MAG TPA: four helix bundle suffix domain-containing protein [Verrucomicrobiae bacterium]
MTVRGLLRWPFVVACLAGYLTIGTNIAICLIHQANYLIDHQLRRLEKDFLEQGGLRERMTRARLNHRAQATRNP